MAETIFSKIIRKEIPADIVFENDKVLAFRDINPQAPIHVLIIPKIDIEKIFNFDPSLHSEYLIEMFTAAKEIASQLKIAEDGFRLVINNGKNGGQDVYHLHMHLLAGRKMNWPPG